MKPIGIRNEQGLFLSFSLDFKFLREQNSLQHLVRHDVNYIRPAPLADDG